MKKTLKKCLAIILAIITVISSCSVMMSVFAEELRLNDAEVIESSESEHETDPVIVSEVTEERTEYTKTFVMSDGSFTRTLYSQPIHFKSNDYWVDYDNTLKESQNGEIYTTSSRETSVSLSSKAAEGRTVFIEGDNYNILWGYNDGKASKLRVNNIKMYILMSIWNIQYRQTVSKKILY